MADLKLPFEIQPNQPPKGEYVKANFDELLKYIKDVRDAVEDLGSLLVSGTFTNTSKLITDSNGHVNQPNQPNFVASLEPAGSTVVTYTGRINPVVFSTESLDIGGNYNNSTGIFTAPVAGKYFFSTFFPIQYGGGSPDSKCRLQLVTSNTTIQGSITSLVASQITYLSASIVIDLDANDTVQVLIEPTTSTGTFQQPLQWVYDGVGNAVQKAYFTGTLIN